MVFRAQWWGLCLPGLALMVLSGGCALHSADAHMAALAQAPVPRELCKQTLPPYRVEAPDILLVQVADERDPNRVIEVGDTYTISMTGNYTLDDKPLEELTPIEQAELPAATRFKVLSGDYVVGPDGSLDLGPIYRKFKVQGLTVDQAQDQLVEYVKRAGQLKEPQIWLELSQLGDKQAIAGEHLVRPDGTISLGTYGQLFVAGMTLDEIQVNLANHLKNREGRYRFQNPQVAVDVFAYNSKVVYIVMDGGGYGEQVVRLPYTGNETVLDAMAQVNGLSQVSSKRVWVARPAPADATQTQILDVHWSAITAEGVTTTNYQLMPGDRIYVKADKLIATDNFLAKIFAPVERVFGTFLLGRYAVQGQNFGR